MINSTVDSSIRRSRTVLRPATLALVAPLLLLTACSQPPWQKASTATASTTPAVTASATAKPKATPVASPAVENDLAEGSVERKLSAGGVNLTVHYWSTLPVDEWSATATKPLNVSVTGRFADGSKQNIFLNSMTMTTDVSGPKGRLQSPAETTDQSTVGPGYLIKAPGSYGNVVTIPSLNAAATSVTLNFTYQVLAQSAPKSSTYLKQAAADTVVIALAR